MNETQYRFWRKRSLTCVSTLALSISVFASAIKPLMAQPVLKNEHDHSQLFYYTYQHVKYAILRIFRTNISVNFNNLFNAAGLHQRRGYSLLHSETHSLRCLNADGCGPQLERHTQPKQLALAFISYKPRHFRHIILLLRSVPWWLQWHILLGKAFPLVRKCLLLWGWKKMLIWYSKCI